VHGDLARSTPPTVPEYGGRGHRVGEDFASPVVRDQDPSPSSSSHGQAAVAQAPPLVHTARTADDAGGAGPLPIASARLTVDVLKFHQHARAIRANVSRVSQRAKQPDNEANRPRRPVVAFVVYRAEAAVSFDVASHTS